jgi:hypothetical protein
MKEPMRRVATFIFLAIGLVSAVSSAHAQIPEPEPITTPVPDQWRGPFEQFLRDLGVDNQRTIVGKTNAFQIGGRWYPDSILFRIEDSTTCFNDMCFTVIGRIVDNKFHADAMFSAGKWFTRGDVFVPLFGYQTLPAWLVGEKITVTLLETPKGWIVAPQSN